jgi:hypothetical protein
MDVGERRVIVRLVVAKSGEPQGIELHAGGARSLALTFAEADELATTANDELRRLLAVARGMRHDDPPPPGS